MTLSIEVKKLKAILLDDTLSSEVYKNLLNALKDSIVQG